MKDVFVSYSHQDKAFAGQLRDRLEADGISVWIDYKDAPWGSPFPAAIEDGLDHSRHIICLMSPSWRASGWATIERYSSMVDDPDGFIGKLLPILIDRQTDVPRFLKPLVYIDCSSPGSLEREYPRIREHIISSRRVSPTSRASPPRLLESGGSELPSLRYIFVVGHPGAGKSTFGRVLASYSQQRGLNVDRRSDYPFLQALYRLDVARGKTNRFESDARSEFTVKDPGVYDEALKLIHDEVIVVDAPANGLVIIEFSRPHYDSAFLYYTMRALVNSAIVHIKAPLNVCEARNEGRRIDLEKRLAGVITSADAFDFDPDLHYVPPSVYARYESESEQRADQSLVLALMPARAYVAVDNTSHDLAGYKEQCRSVVESSLRPLLDAPEGVAAFYRRRISALHSFVAHDNPGSDAGGEDV